MAQAPTISTTTATSRKLTETDVRRRLRVLALVTEAFGGHGGIAQYNRDFLSALASLEQVESVWILPRLAADGASNPDSKVQQWRPVYGRAKYAIAALWAAVRQRPDVVLNAHLYHGALASLVARLSGAKLVSQLHGTEIWEPAAAAHRRALERSVAVLAVSRDTRRRFLAQSGSSVDCTRVLPNTVRPEFSPGDRAAARARFGLSSEFAILTVGRLDARRGGYKGHDRVLREMPGLVSGPRPVVYLIAGDGDDRGRLEDLTGRLGLADRVRFLGKVPDAELPDLYRAADLFAMPSTGEGFGIVFLEAMACGTPAIGLNAGGAPDALVDGELGRCVSAEAFPEALAEAVAAPPPDRERLAAEVRRRFGSEAFRGRVAELVDSLY